MKCWHCNQEISDSSEYCPYCGRKQSEDPDKENTQSRNSTIADQEDRQETTKQNKADGDTAEQGKRAFGIRGNISKTDFLQLLTVHKKKLQVLAGVAVVLIAFLFLFKDELYSLDKKGIFHTHEWISATCTKPKTCRICGVTEGKASEHKWVDATCTAPRTCSECGLTEGEALGHKWKDATCTAPRTCSECGLTEGEALGHKWEDATCTQPRTCSVCKATDGEALGHDWIPATYDSPMTCERCGTTQGNVKGYVSSDELLKGAFGGEISFGVFNTHAFEFENELKKCRKIVFGISIAESSGDPFGEYGVWGRSHGDWKRLGTLNVEAEGEVYYDTFIIDPAIDIDAIICLPVDDPGHEVTWQSTFHFYEAQVE